MGKPRHNSKKIKPGSLKAKNLKIQRNVIGKMGKPMKSRKNKKIKKVDPAAVNRRRDKKKPRDDFVDPAKYDEQEIPKKVERYAKNKNKYKKMNKLPVMDKYDTQGAKKSLKLVPVFEQGEREHDHTFMNRMERETEAVIAKTRIEEKYKVDLDEQADGDILIKKRISEKKRKKNRKRLQEKKDKKIEKEKRKKLDTEMSFDKFRDEVKFGEVVMQPPTLSSAPRKAQISSEKPRPGKKSLLLHDILDKNKESSLQPKKKKFLSPAQQVLLANERERVIELYREMKKKGKPND